MHIRSDILNQLVDAVALNDRVESLLDKLLQGVEIAIGRKRFFVVKDSG